MAHIFDILTVLIGIILTLVGYTYKTDKTAQDSNIKQLEDENTATKTQLEVLKATMVTDQQVRQVVREYVEPLSPMLTEIRAELKEVRHSVSHIPKRRVDNEP